MINTYKIKRAIFQWNAESIEEGGSIVLTIFGYVHFVKYKESTLIHFGKDRYSQARKHVEAFEE